MVCEQCGSFVKRTLADNSVSRIKRYKTVAYYCDTCDEIHVIDKYKDRIDPHKFDGEYEWLRAQNPNLQGTDTPNK